MKKCVGEAMFFIFCDFVDTALYNEERCERCVGRDEWQYRHTVCHSTSLWSYLIIVCVRTRSNERVRYAEDYQH